MPDPDLNLLFALDALLTHQNVTRAARSLDLSVSAMSRALTRLRLETGDALLVRAGRHMVLTPRAEEILENTRTLVHDARALLRPALATVDFRTLRRTFTIRANEAFVEVFGACVIADVAALAPLIRLNFVTKSEKSDAPLRSGAADLEIGVVEEMGPEVRVRALYRDRYVAVVKKGHFLDAGETVTLSQFARAGHVVTPYGENICSAIDAAMTSSGLSRLTVAVVPTFAAALAVALESDLVALLPASFVDTPAPWGRSVYAFELPVAVAGFTICLMWHPRLDNDPMLSRLRGLVIEACRDRVPL